jgi:hypothetical protein
MPRIPPHGFEVALQPLQIDTEVRKVCDLAKSTRRRMQRLPALFRQKPRFGVGYRVSARLTLTGDVSHLGTSQLNLHLYEIIMGIHGKGGRSTKMEISDYIDIREVAEA